MTNQFPRETTEAHRSDQTMAQLRETLDAETWRTVNRRLLAKMLSEFLFEELIDPDPAETSETSGGATRFRLDCGEAEYRFEAVERRLDSYHVPPESVERRGGDAAADWSPATDAIQFLRDSAETLGVPDEALPHLVREHTNTLLADAHLAENRSEDAPLDPTGLSYVDLDARLDGHPWITYNKGRIGFGYEDYRRYAPESREQVRLRWVAARRTSANFNAVPGIGYDQFVTEELRDDRLAEFEGILEDRGLDPANYYLLPVHEWHWDDSIASFFADEIARDNLVPLGEGRTDYQPLQSIRTLVNADDPEGRHVKLPLRLLNTLVYRGIPGKKIEVAPEITEMLRGIRDGDPFLADECEVILPGEVASVNYDHPVYNDLDSAPYQQKELLGAIWRESPHTYLAPDERAIPLAALMHEEGGTAVLSTLVEQSGLSLAEWFDRLFDALLPPLLHFTYKYGIGFSPHGEDTILVLEDCAPTRIGLKDFIDLSLAERDLPEHEAIPDHLWDVLGTKDPDRFRHCIVSSLFVCVLRYVADLAARHHGYDEDRFWRQARERILDYQRRFPELEDRFELFDLLDSEFTKLCLNRNRFTNYGYEDAGERPSISKHGTLPNPLHEVANDE